MNASEKPFRVGLVGARGYVGQEVLALLEKHPARFVLCYATSSGHAGKRICDVFDGLRSSVIFEAPSPKALAAREDLDVIVLGMPNGLAADYVAALTAARYQGKIIDLSSDHRHQKGWVYGLVDVFADDIRGATHIANPGCYATAATLGLYPIRSHFRGAPVVFGVSGYSGAGTKPSDKNDANRLRDNLIPYQHLDHMHQFEISGTVGTPVRFMPNVAAFFRGLSVSMSVPVDANCTQDALIALIRQQYAASQTVIISDDLPEIAEITGTPMAKIGGFALDPKTQTFSVTVVLDNLLKGAASQCLENMMLAVSEKSSG